jgi:N4-(beta-N-acetylglucosaminyl)-L-asparaginase
VAKLVLERTDHLLLVGEGALRFALAHGFKAEDLLTEESRVVWLKWKESMSDHDFWGPGLAAPDSVLQGLNYHGAMKGSELLALATEIIAHPPTGTINCLAINERGDISGTTTTSGMAFKIPGRVGDSPLIGCGLFVDNEIGAAGSTGRGEANLFGLCSFLIVEEMRRGAHPKDAGLTALRRVAKATVEKRLLNARNEPNFGLNFYALNARGEYAGVSMYPAKFAVCTDQGPQTLDTEPLFHGSPE